MTAKLTRSISTARVVLSGFLAALAIGSVSTATASAATTAQSGGEYRTSPWAQAETSPAATPSLTNDVGRPESGSSGELLPGLGLVGVGVALLAYAVASLPRRGAGLGRDSLPWATP